MKLALTFLSFFLIQVIANGQAFTEDFESGSGAYTTNKPECNDNATDYFALTNEASISATFTGNATNFFAAQDMDATPCNTTIPGTITWTGINITGCTGLSLSIDMAEDDDAANQDWDSGDFMHIEVNIDGGGYVPVIWVENDGSAFNSAPFIDTDFDGTGDGTEITSTWQTFVGAIAGTGVSLDLRITISLDAGDEDIAFDNIIITGTGCGAPSNTITTTGVTGNPWTVDCNTNDAGTVTFTSTGTFNAPNIYTAQLSDATGSFTTPTNIGTLTSTANSGTINITIPPATAAGTAYRIRVVSDDPAVTGTDNGTNLTINNTGAAAGNMIVNEMSNGATGSQEYMEFLVVGTPCTNVNVQNLIFDDNNGDWGASGVASGHFRLSNHPQWGCVQNGTLIVVYNSGDKNGSLPADDQTDSNGDNVYIIPDTSIYVERCTTDPNGGSSAYNVGGCTYTSGPTITWTALGMANSGDVAQTRDAAGTFFHGIGYSSPTTTPAGGVSLATTGGGNAFIFDNSIDNDFTNSGNFSGGAVASFESPGAQNTAANGAYISSMICTILPVDWLYFDLEQQKDKVILQWATASENLASHYEVERSSDAINFEVIGSVQANNTSTLSIYNWHDENPIQGQSYYRIKQIDEDHSLDYTSVKSAYFYGDIFEISNAYQTGNELNVSFNSEIGSMINYQLYDIDGRLILTGNSSNNQTSLNLSNLSTGMYILNAHNGIKSASRKVFVR